MGLKCHRDFRTIAKMGVSAVQEKNQISRRKSSEFDLSK